MKDGENEKNNFFLTPIKAELIMMRKLDVGELVEPSISRCLAKRGRSKRILLQVTKDSEDLSSYSSSSNSKE